MIQDIAPHQFSNAYTPQIPESDAILLCYRERQVLAKIDETGQFKFPTFREAEPYDEQIYKEYTYLFSIDHRHFYLGKPEYFDMLPDYTANNTTVFRDAKPKYSAFAGITGYQLFRWYDSHRFCGKCGAPMQQDSNERMMCCPQCKTQEYPKIMPAAIIGVTDGRRLLMSKYANREFQQYALLAGFAEIGEAIEETVRREVMEEVGLKIKNITYYKSQPWSFSDTLLLGFFAELDGSPEVTLDEEELALAEWFEREEIPVKAHDLSLTNEMIMTFKEGGFPRIEKC